MTEPRGIYVAGTSPAEASLRLQLIAAEIDGWLREYQFHPSRRWRFDYAFPVQKLAVEIDGGTWTRGRHTRGAGYAMDCIKYAEAAVLGWRVMRFTTEQVEDGTALKYIEFAMRGANDGR